MTHGRAFHSKKPPTGTKQRDASQKVGSDATVSPRPRYSLTIGAAARLAEHRTSPGGSGVSLE